MVHVKDFLIITDMIGKLLCIETLFVVYGGNQFSNVGQAIFELIFWLKHKLLC